MKKYSFILVFVILSFVFANSQARADLISTFDSSAEGWTALNRPALNPDPPANEFTGSWQSIGGNPGGFFQGVDTGIGGLGFFQSPDSWAGNWSQYVGGTLRFDINPIRLETGLPVEAPDVIIASDLTHYAIYTGIYNPAEGQWTTFGVELIPSNFTTFGGSDFNTIMSNVVVLRIRGEYFYNDENVGLDNVSVNASVPEPATMLLLGSGLIGLWGIRRKFKK